MSCVNDEILTFYASGGNDMENNGTSSNNVGQSFKVPKNSFVCGFSWYGGKGTVGTQPGTFKVEILSGDYGGTVIATTGTLSSDVMNDHTSPNWYKFEFLDTVLLNADTTYYLKCTQLSGSTNDVIRWYTDTEHATYDNGNAFVSGSSVTGADKYFRIHGVDSTSVKDMIGSGFIPYAR